MNLMVLVPYRYSGGTLVKMFIYIYICIYLNIKPAIVQIGAGGVFGVEVFYRPLCTK